MKSKIIVFFVFLLLSLQVATPPASLAQGTSTYQHCLFDAYYQTFTAAATTPARNLTTVQALDMLAYLVSRGHVSIIDGPDTLKFDANCHVIVPQFDPTDITFPRVAIRAVVSGIHFRVYGIPPEKSRTLQNLDPAMVVFLYRLSTHMKAWGVTEIFHRGTGRLCNEYTTNSTAENRELRMCTKCGPHELGRAIDVAGFTGEIAAPLLANAEKPYGVDVYADWGMQPVPQPGMEPELWKKGVPTAYRLMLATDLSTQDQVRQFLAYSMFLDVYDFATREAADRKSPRVASATQIGQSSELIIHPDYRTDIMDSEHPGMTLAQTHQDHMHVEIGPSCRRKEQ